jgi:L-asparaginase
MARATVSLLAMGGTISTQPTAGGAAPRLGATDLAELLDGLRGSVELRPRDVLTVSSRAVAANDMWLLAKVVEDEIAAGADGVVITHGTDTLEETAYALALLVDTRVPVVLTGAMRGPHLPGPDGQANLVASIVAALHSPLADYGPVVVFQDEIHLAHLVTKHHSARVAAFTSPAAGPVGFVSENEVELLLGPAPHTEVLPRIAPPSKRVDVVLAVAGGDGAVVDAIADQIDGLVIAGVGGGHLPPSLAEAALRATSSGTPVVLASRCEDGRVLTSTYAGFGSETHLLAEGLLRSRVLAPVKARLRLLFGLSAGLTGNQLFGPPLRADDPCC